MAEIHNISDLKAIRLLENELLDVRNELRQIPGYDPTETLAQNVRTVIQAGQLAAKWLNKVQLELAWLKKEQENDKMVARTYPIGGIVVAGVDPGGESTKTVAWFDESGRSISDPFANYHPSGESVSERLLGSTDGYGK